MAEEIQEAVQIVRVAFEGVNVAMKVGSGGLGAVKSCATFIGGMLAHEKMSGQTAMKELLKRGGDMQVLRFRQEDMKTVKRLAKRYGILYAAIPQAGREGGMGEIVFHSEAVPRANMLLAKLTSASILNFDEYLTKKDDNQVGKLLEFFKSLGNAGEAAKPPEDSRADGDNPLTGPAKEHLEMAERMKAIALAKDSGLRDVTMSKSLITDEDDLAVTVRVPGTWGENMRCFHIEKKDIVDIHDGKSMLVYLDKNKKYDLLEKGGSPAQALDGVELLKHYDKVDASLRLKAGMPQGFSPSADVIRAGETVAPPMGRS